MKTTQPTVLLKVFYILKNAYKDGVNRTNPVLVIRSVKNLTIKNIGYTTPCDAAVYNALKKLESYSLIVKCSAKNKRPITYVISPKIINYSLTDIKLSHNTTTITPKTYDEYYAMDSYDGEVLVEVTDYSNLMKRLDKVIKDDIDTWKGTKINICKVCEKYEVSVETKVTLKKV